MSDRSIRVLPWGLAAGRRLLSSASPSTGKTSLPAVASSEDKKDGKPLYRRLSALGLASEGSVSRTMNKWVNEGRAVRVTDLIKSVKGLRKYRCYGHALELMDWMVKERGMNLSCTNSAICLDLICKVRSIEAAEEFFNNLPDTAKDERTYGALLSCYCSAKLPDKATALHDKMKALNIASNTLAYNNLMLLYAKIGQPENVSSVFWKMKACNIAADNFSYCILMNSYASLNDIEAVDAVIREMEEGNEVVIQWTAYSTLAAIYNFAGMHSKAELALKKLERLVDGSRYREPFHFLISLYASAGSLENVKRVWKSLKDIFSKQTNKSYFIVLHALYKLDDIEGMKQCFDEWKSVSLSYDPKIVNLLVGAYLRKDMEGEAKVVLEGAKEKGLSPDMRTCELFMDYYLKKCKIEKAVAWCEIAASNTKGWKLDKERLHVFLRQFQEASDADGFKRFCKKFEKDGLFRVENKAVEGSRPSSLKGALKHKDVAPKHNTTCAQAKCIPTREYLHPNAYISLVQLTFNDLT